MEREERLLASFCDEDEALAETWSVRAVKRGWSGAPSVNDDDDDVQIGYSGHRLLWFDDELETVALSAIESVERDAIDYSEAPGIVRVGSLAMIIGLIATAGGVFLGNGALPTAMIPAIVGVAIFGATILVAQTRDLSGSEYHLENLRIKTVDGTVTVWGPADVLDEIKRAIAPT